MLLAPVSLLKIDLADPGPLVNSASQEELISSMQMSEAISQQIHFHGLLLIYPPQSRPLRVVHSALCTRVILNLRKVAAHVPTLGDLARTSLAFGNPRGQGILGSYMSGDGNGAQDIEQINDTMYEG